MTHRRGEGSPIPKVSAALAAPAAEGFSQKVRTNHSDSMASVSLTTEYLFPFGSELPAVEAPNVEIEGVAESGVSDQRDEDGAAYFEDGGARPPLQVRKLPPDVPVPSKEMI